jgi:hypothetical protein
MLEKELEKLKELTEKLKATGDVSEDEADWIYIFRKMCMAIYMDYEFVPGKSYKCVEAALKNFPAPADLQGLKHVSTAFLEWYENVVKTKGGHCLSTIPVGAQDAGISVFEEKQIETILKDFLKSLPEPKVPVGGGLLSCDIDKNGFPVRYGLEQREGNRKIKDTRFLLRMARKLKTEGDITEEEADSIYTLVKYAQAVYIDSIDRPEQKNGLTRLYAALSSWYKNVLEHVKAHKTGNFLYTLPVNDHIELGEAKKYVSQALSLLPEECVSIIYREPGPAPENFPLDSFSSRLIAPGPQIADAYSYRYGSLKRAGFDINSYEKVNDTSEMAYIWFEIGMSTPSCFENKNRKFYGFIARLEFLKSQGLLPFGVMKVRSSHYRPSPFHDIETDNVHYVLFDKDTYRRARFVLDTPDEMIKLSSLAGFEKKEATKRIVSAVESAIANYLKKQELEEDWQEMEVR